ncbi:MAG: Fic family protein [Pirellulales bacterium]|nr:Fic family protein [Pirellulales bacterium]
METTAFATDCPGVLRPISEGGVAFIPNRLPPALKIEQPIRDADEAALLALGELRAIVPTLPNPGLITRPFLRREAILSSRIEGTYVELDQLCEFEARHEGSSAGSAQNMSEQEKDFGEVHNYTRALQFGLSQLGTLPVCNRLLREVHRCLLDGVRGQNKSPGAFRRGQCFIGSSRDIRQARYVPPPAEAVEEAMADLERYVNSPGDTLPTLVRNALIHYQFEAIHPFADGNGRLGRLMISLLLAEQGILPEPLLYLSAFFERRRDEYVNRLTEVSRSGAWTPWIAFFLEGIRHEALDATRRARKLLELRERYRRTIGEGRGSAALLQLVDSLFDMPRITVPAAMRMLEMTYNGAKKNLEKLVRDGVLIDAAGQGRARGFVAAEIIQVLESETA